MEVPVDCYVDVSALEETSMCALTLRSHASAGVGVVQPAAAPVVVTVLLSVMHAQTSARAHPSRLSGLLHVAAAGAGQQMTLPFGTGRMDSTTFAQLGLRVGPGAGYSLCHQGCCEHRLVITDVRRLHPLDPQHRSAYPLLLFQVST